MTYLSIYAMDIVEVSFNKVSINHIISSPKTTFWKLIMSKRLYLMAVYKYLIPLMFNVTTTDQQFINAYFIH